MIEKVIEVTVSHSVATAYSVADDIKTAISPVVIGDDVADRRDSLKKQLERQLHAYEIRRNPQAHPQPLNAATILMPAPPQVELKLHNRPRHSASSARSSGQSPKRNSVRTTQHRAMAHLFSDQGRATMSTYIVKAA